VRTMATAKYQKCIVRSPRILDEIAYHKPAPKVIRYHLMGEELVSGADVFVSYAQLKDFSPDLVSEYVSTHTHDVSQVYVLLGETGSLEVEVTLEEEVYVVASPGAVFIPRNVKHKVKYLKGTGKILVVLPKARYP